MFAVQFRIMRHVKLGPTLTQQVTDQLRDAIVSGELTPHSLHSATALGAQFGVSRTPIREAAFELARLGLVSIEPNKGIRILQTSIDALLEGFELRLVIEVPMARKAAMRARGRDVPVLAEAFDAFGSAAATGDATKTLRADRDFHTAILELAGNKRAAETLREQRNMVLQTGVGTVPTSRTCEECFEDHRDIFEAIVAGDGDAAATAMRMHIIGTARMLLRQETSKRPEFGSVDVDAQLSWIQG